MRLTTADHLLGCLLCEGALWSGLDERHRDLLGGGVYSSALLLKVAHSLTELAHAGTRPDLAAVLPQLDDLAAQEAAVALASRTETDTEGNPDRLREHWSGCLLRLEQDQLAARAESGTPDIHERLELKRREHTTDRRVLPRPR